MGRVQRKRTKSCCPESKNRVGTSTQLGAIPNRTVIFPPRELHFSKILCCWCVVYSTIHKLIRKLNHLVISFIILLAPFCTYWINNGLIQIHHNNSSNFGWNLSCHRSTCTSCCYSYVRNGQTYFHNTSLFSKSNHLSFKGLCKGMCVHVSVCVLGFYTSLPTSALQHLISPQ